MRRHKIEWGQVYAAFSISEEQNENLNLIDMQAKVLSPVVASHLVATLRGHILEGAPYVFEVSISAPANLWAYIRKALGFKRYRTVTETRTKEIKRNVCPHGLVPLKETHFDWLVEDRGALEVER